MCNVILKDPNNGLWQMGISDNGNLSTTYTSFTANHVVGPYLDTGFNSWQLSADVSGRIVANLIPVLPTSLPALPYVPLASPGGTNFKLFITFDGMLRAAIVGAPLQDYIPYQPDVTMSKWPLSIGLICSTCNNADVTASADFGLWCCVCSSFVPPEDTNIVVVLDE